MKIAYLITPKNFWKSTGFLATALAALIVLPSLSSAANPVVRQGTTSTYGVLAATTVTNTGATTISGTAGGDIGLSPGTSFTGSASVTTSGVLHITDTAASIAQTDLVTAYNDLGIPTPTTLSSADLAGQTVLPGTYATASGTFANSGTLTFDAQGDPSAVFIFQAASTVITSPSSTMVLTNGAQACNIYWQVGSSATLGVSSTFRGHIYALTSITANTGATIYGQLLARNGAVTLDTNTIVNDSCVTAAATTTSTPSSVTTAPSSVTIAPGSDVDTLPSTGIDSLIWILGVVFIIGLITGIIRIRS
jgi:Ice-binding-like